MGEEIRVVIEKDGKLTLKVSGKDGPHCLTLTQALENEMGQVLDRQRTNEFFKKAQIALKNKTIDPLKSA
jgi:K+/H+ antiporter YhaU regulatory subunit KhtT